MKKHTILLALTIVFLQAQAQDNSLSLSLKQAIELAKKTSLDAKATQTRLDNSSWQYRQYQSRKYPLISLNGVLPNLNRSIIPVTQPDGSEDFVERSQANYSFSLQLQQEIGLTGGQVFVSNGAERIDRFGDISSTAYLFDHIEVGFSQPIFGYNSFAWDKRIEPLKYQKSKKQYLDEMQQIAITTINLFFAAYLSDINYEVAKKNKTNNDTLYKIAQGRYNLGKIAENELLQMELSVLNAGLSVEENFIARQNAFFELKSHLGIDLNKELQLIPPTDISFPEIDYTKALSEAKENNPQILDFEVQLKEAKSNVAMAKGNNGPEATISASYGLNNRTTNIGDAYRDPQDQELFRLGIQVPIIDWGRSKAAVKIAEANQELVETNILQQKIDFEQEIFLAVQGYSMQTKKLKIAARADTISAKRYEIARQRFLIGKVGITDLNLALSERDNSKTSYIRTLREAWLAKYQLRKLTLYDFEKNKRIE